MKIAHGWVPSFLTRKVISLKGDSDILNSSPFLLLKDPLEEGMATQSSILAWRIPMDQGAWQATGHGITKSWTRLSD